MSEAELAAVRLTEEQLLSAFSPRFDPAGKTLAFLSQQAACASGVHNGTSSLHAFHWPHVSAWETRTFLLSRYLYSLFHFVWLITQCASRSKRKARMVATRKRTAFRLPRHAGFTYECSVRRRS